ncbi:hypothetical protein EV702DRAFT_1207742 [Suillus placidus]|uniref:Uncharacterized protein n=1 Tax=Suillus placidus TaxID=48579 RepID=A0A9P6ZFK0_9AGAM|nr:hypothetical protein EV702DRAFT_1207742 [Suillus placidus]
MPSTGGKLAKSMAPISTVGANDEALNSSSGLEDILRGEYEPFAYRVGPGVDGDPHTSAINMRIQRRMEIATTGVHEMLAEAFSLLETPEQGDDRKPANDHAEERQERDNGTLITSRTCMHRAMQDEVTHTKAVWQLIRLARALRVEVGEVMKDCAASTDETSPHKTECINRHMSSVSIMAHQIMIACATILKNSSTGLGHKGDGEWVKKRADKRELCVWTVIELCRRSLQEVQAMVLNSIDW